MAFTRRMKSVLITAVFYIGAGGAVFTIAPERTGRIIITRCFSSLGPNKNGTNIFTTAVGNQRKCFENVFATVW